MGLLRWNVRELLDEAFHGFVIVVVELLERTEVGAIAPTGVIARVHPELEALRNIACCFVAREIDVRVRPRRGSQTLPIGDQATGAARVAELVICLPRALEERV